MACEPRVRTSRVYSSQPWIPASTYPRSTVPARFASCSSVAVPLVISYTTECADVRRRPHLPELGFGRSRWPLSLPAGVLHYNLAALAIGTVAYANAFVGQYEGADQHQRVGPVVWQGIYLSLIAAA